MSQTSRNSPQNENTVFIRIGKSSACAVIAIRLILEDPSHLSARSACRWDRAIIVNDDGVGGSQPNNTKVPSIFLPSHKRGPHKTFRYTRTMRLHRRGKCSSCPVACHQERTHQQVRLLFAVRRTLPKQRSQCNYLGGSQKQQR